MKCNECPKTFLNISTFKTHSKEQHEQNRNDVNFKCQVCKKEIKLQRNLKRHQETHLEEKEKFDCCYCNKSFTRKA